MKRTFKFYMINWSILFVLFQAISFVSVGWTGVEKYTLSFWIGYICIDLAFIGQIICAFFALRDHDRRKTFYNLSLIVTSYIGLILSFVFGGLCMIISPLPYWVGVLLCVGVLGFNGIATVKTYAAVDLVSETDEKVKKNTLFIRNLTVDIENLMLCTQNETMKTLCKKVYEVVRYSDPMSNEALSSMENEITVKFLELSDAVKANDHEKATILSNEFIILINDRNKKCKLLK